MVGITKDDGALPSRGLGGASEKSGLLVVLGYIGAQTWLPIVGVVADMYRGGDLALSGLNPLLFSYLVVLGTTACAASFARWRDEWSRGVFGAFAGALAAIAAQRFCSFPNGAPLWQLRFYASCPARCSAWAAVCSPWYGANALDGWMLRRAPGFRFSSYSLPACWRPSLSP